jgi:tetratricopeptide (TPR) repeat protein
MTEPKELLLQFTRFMTVGAAGGLASMRTWLDEHPELLNPALDPFLEQWLVMMERVEDNASVETVGNYVDLWRDCWNYGVDPAFEHATWRREGDEELTGMLYSSREVAMKANSLYETTEDARALRLAIKAWDALCVLAGSVPASRLFRIDCSDHRAVAHLKQYRLTRKRADIDIAIDTFQTSVEQTRQLSNSRRNALINLALAWAYRYEAKHRLAHLDEAIRVYQQVEAERFPLEDEQVCQAIVDLGSCLLMRFHQAGDKADLRLASEAYQTAIEATPPGSPRLATRLAKLGSCWADLYKLTADPHHLAEAARCMTESVKVAPADESERSRLGAQLFRLLRQMGGQ